MIRVFSALVVMMLGLAAADIIAQEGGIEVKGATIRPAFEKAKVEGCRIAKPGDYTAKVGDLIELDYSYPVVPGAMPKKLDFKLEASSGLAAAPLGVRRVVTPELLGVSTIAFYFDAKSEGTHTLTLIIDQNDYTYKFKIMK